MRKNKNRYWIHLAVLIFVILPLGAWAQNPHIDLKVNGSGSSAKIEFLNSACPEEPGNKGCVELGHGSKNWVSWELDQSSTQAGWKLTALFFSPDGTHWGEASYPLKDCTVADFKLSEIDRDTGQASSAEIIANGKRMRIWDENGHVCDTWYRVFATNADGDQIDSDPIIKNKGNN